jgi:SAM-dependent methyltransferase
VSRERHTPALLEAASAGYRRAGRFAWHFARGKLSGDPAFRAILRLGLLEGRPRILDLGCGQGLLAEWLLAAHACHARGEPGSWPPDWPAPPQLSIYTGIELNAAEVARARAAFAAHDGVQLSALQGNICDVPFPAADAVVILDVLHYLEYPAQEQVLGKVRAALPAGGRLLLRIGDAGGGFGFLLSRITDQIVVLFRAGRWRRLHCRTLADWCALLERRGFGVRPVPMSEGTPFTNMLLVAEAR